MHKPIFVLTLADSTKVAKSFSESFLSEMCNDGSGSHDWFQGLKASGRWNPEYSYFDIPKPIADKHATKILTQFIKSTQKDILHWIKEGNKELKEKKKELGWILANFSIASGKTVAHIFDNTGYSGGEAIVDEEFLKNVKKYAKTQNENLYVCGFDIHY